MVQIKVGDRRIEALIDTGAALSLLPLKTAPPDRAPGHTIVQGIEGQNVVLAKTLPLLVEVGDHQISHQFVCHPSCPIALLGRDILTKLQAEISFRNGNIEVRLPKQQASHYIMALMSAETFYIACQDIKEDVMLRVDPMVWAETGGVARARNAAPVRIKLKEGSSPVRVRQYPLKLATQIGLKPVILKFLRCGWLREGTSPYNTPIIGIPKPNGQYHLVQDLRQVNKLVEAPYPVVPNPHTILGQVPENHGWFSVIDLKDAFFSIPLDPESQQLFAFEWEDPDAHYKAQYLWTVIPQGLTCAPEIFGSQLKRDLAPFLANHPSCNIVQYCDDLLLSTETEAACKKQTVGLLNYLGRLGYKVSKDKIQLVKQQVTFLGYQLTQLDRPSAHLGTGSPRWHRRSCGLDSRTTRRTEGFV
uniref:ribonuclease H n=1 Tax=Chelonoidis abingdonii TaxID=106734 RepID=A0A8C0HBC6_CHEAB